MGDVGTPTQPQFRLSGWKAILFFYLPWAVGVVTVIRWMPWV